MKCSNFTTFVKICPYSLMDRISDSGSDGCGSIPHGGTKKEMPRHLLFCLYVRDQDSDYTEYVYHIVVREFEVREFLLAFGYEGECACLRTVVHDLSEEHSA